MATRTPVPRAAHALDVVPVHVQIAALATSSPSAMAAATPSSALTYDELARGARRLAAALHERGIRAETPVGVCLPRSPALLVALLGVFEAGATAVLLDPAWPRRRIERILRAAGAVVLVAEEARFDGVEIVRPIAAKRTTARRVDVHPDNLAYLVHTSGSTGAPKLVGVTHRALAVRAALYREAYGISSGDRASWISPPGSSIAAAELWPYLTAGASVFPADAAFAASPAELRDWMLAERITKSFVMMPLAEALLAESWPSETALELLTIGGDTVHRWPRGLPFEVVVEYGSAEANAVSSGLVPPEDRLTSATVPRADRDARPPIGRPWPGVGIQVVDAQLREAPPGDLGELCVASAQLARGYVGAPGATAAAFAPAAGGRRLYRTGDLVHVRRDGRLVHHGRIDGEVKIAGVRVEPAETEAALLEHPHVREAVVVPAVDPTGNRRLAAYLVVRSAVPVPELRRHVASRLPEPFVPAAYTFLGSLPLNAAMKLDRSALPEPEWPGLDRHAAADASDDAALEAEVARLWSELLGRAYPPPDAGFFEDGGTSLLAGRLVARVRERWRVPLRIADFMRDPTPAALVHETRALLRAREEALRAPPSDARS